DRRYQSTENVEVDLVRGRNSFRLEASSTSGRGPSPTLLVTHVPPPLRVVLDRLVAKKPGGKAVPARRLAHGQDAFAEVEEGQVQLHGRLIWSDEKATRGRKNLRIRSWVNGFQQLPCDCDLTKESK